MTAAERAREEGRRAGLLEAVDTISARLKPRGDNFQREPAADLPIRLAKVLHELRLQAAGPAQVRLDGGAGPAGGGELTARVLIVLQAHLAAREKFFREERGGYQPPSAAAQEEARKEIRAALIRYHETNGDREKWRRESEVLAAGFGILYSPTHNGELEKEKELKRLAGRPLPAGWLPKLYLELWRPWKLLRGKPDPVSRFAELCFERRREEADGR
jgi:hypothetical protein